MTTSKKTAARPPVAKLNIGPIFANVWQRSGEKGSFYTVNFERRYRAGDTWETSNSFSRDDLLVLAKLADESHSRILELQSE